MLIVYLVLGCIVGTKQLQYTENVPIILIQKRDFSISDHMHCKL